MLKNILLPLFLLQLHGLTHAQHEITIEPIKKCLPDEYVLTEVFVTVPENVGTVLKGPFNSPQPAIIAPDIRTGIMNAVGRHCPAKEGAIPLAIKVNELMIYEVSSTSEYAMAAMNVDVLRMENGEWIHFFNSGGTVRSKGLDVTHHHGRNIARALEEDLQELYHGEGGVKAHFPALAAAHLSRPTIDRDLWLPIMQGVLPQGVFKTFNDLRAGRVMKIAAGQDIHEHAARLKKDTWGYADGEFLYMWFDKRPVRLERRDHDFLGRFHLTEHDVGAVLMGGMMFGLVGSILADGLTKRDHTLTVRLNMMTGDLDEWEDPHFVPMPPKDISHIIHLSKFTKNDAPLKVMDGDRVLATLERNTFCEIHFRSGQSPERVILAGPAEETLELLLPMSQKGTTVHLVQMDKSGKVEVKQVTGQMNERLISSLKETQRRPLAHEFAQ